MNDAAFEHRFNELLQQIRELPEADRRRLEELAAETRRRHGEIRDAGRRAETMLQRLTIRLQLAILRAGEPS